MDKDLANLTELLWLDHKLSSAEIVSSLQETVWTQHKSLNSRGSHQIAKQQIENRVLKTLQVLNYGRHLGIQHRKTDNQRLQYLKSQKPRWL